MALSTRIIKGGALLDDSRRFVEAWNPALDTEANLGRILGENLLAKPSRSRAEDVVVILRRRFVEPGLHILESLRALSASPQPFREACFYETARDDELVARFAGEALFGWRRQGHQRVDPAEVAGWLATMVPNWSPPTRKRVAEGLLATTRDFGLLSGVVNKRMQPGGLSLPGFAYVALRERATRTSSRAVLDSPAWRRYLLDDGEVRGLFHQADRYKVLSRCWTSPGRCPCSGCS